LIGVIAEDCLLKRQQVFEKFLSRHAASAVIGAANCGEERGFSSFFIDFSAYARYNVK
jgi:hypothetical protein